MTAIILTIVSSVFSLQILIRGDFRIIDGEKIQPRVRRPPVLVGSVKSPGKGAGGSTPAYFSFGEF